jgi:formamidopyrimidine-DNA glycosylase
MNQKIITGHRKCFSKILFQARMNPAERIAKLAPSQLKRLFVEMHKVLTTAIAHRTGSSGSRYECLKVPFLPERKRMGANPAADRS